MPMHGPLTCGDARRRRSRAQSWMIPALLSRDGLGLMVRAIAMSAVCTVRAHGFRATSHSTSFTSKTAILELGASGRGG